MASAADGSSSPGSETSEDEPTPGLSYTGAVPERDQEEYIESPRQSQSRPAPQHFPSSQVLPQQQQQQQQRQQHPQHGLPDQVEYLSDDTESGDEDEPCQHEPQGLEQFSRASKEPLQSPSTTIATNSTGPFLVDHNRDGEDELQGLGELRPQPYVQQNNYGGVAYQVSDNEEE
ncbi:hypothetical protein Micbo1qcDRAFT_169245, partial [Microdochium bolleyi]